MPCPTPTQTVSLMNIIIRNFFRLLRSGALGEYEPLEPMSAFKWNRLDQMVVVQGVEAAAQRGILLHDQDVMMNIPDTMRQQKDAAPQPINPQPQLSNTILNRRLRKIEQRERHAIDTNMAALDVLHIIVDTTASMLNRGTMLAGIIQLGSYLRTRGDQVDFVKLDRWLSKLFLRRMAQLQGSMLMAEFHFQKEELPFVNHIEPAAGRLILRSVTHTVEDTAEEWHFRQSKSGFVHNNSALLQRNLRRSYRYFVYAPIETVSSFFCNFARSLQEIEE